MRSKQQPRPSFRWPQQRGDNIPGEDGAESTGPGTDLQGEEGDCVDEDGPVSPSERGCSGVDAPTAKEDEDGEASYEEDEEDANPVNPSPSAINARLNPVALRDTGPPDREPMSPRCPSRDSRESSGPATGSPPPPATRNSSSPVSPASNIVPLPLGVPLLPPQSAAMMAAYIQQTHQRLLLGHSPLSRSSVSPLVSSSCSPPAATPGIHVSPTSGDTSPSATPLPTVLDFSTRKASSTEEEEEEQILNLSKPPTPSSSTETNNGPLDLSVPSRKRPVSEESPPPPRKSSRLSASTPVPAHQEAPASASPYARQVLSPWTSPVASHFPYFAAAVAAAATSQQQLSPKSGAGVVDHQLWNGKMKPPALDKSYQPSEATKALEKMSELSKLGGEDMFRSSSGGSGNAGSGSSGTSGSRHSAWQSHWLNKGADQAKDVLKCVWCKTSFPTLAAMTTHMKEAKHCGVNMPVPPPSSGLHSQPPHQPPMPPTPPQPHPTQTSCSSGGNNSTPNSNKQSPSELNLLIKETMPLPRKLVRGQDVWLGKGAEQTRQILKCMWCGQSFRTLAEMTSHMQQTQHYTNIISQEQIISWKSSDENKGNSGGGGGSGGNSGSGGGSGGGAGGGAPPGSGSGPHGASGGPGAGATSSHVSAVLTCKVCDQAFSSLKELSNHMVKNSHYKEHIMRSITESGGRRRQTREKRKKSLPVRKLLELERAQNEFKNGDAGAAAALAHSLGKHAGRITCEKCGEKIETTIFVEHIRQCIGAGALGVNQRNFLKNALMSNHLSGALPPTESGRKSVNEETSSISSRHHRSPSSASDATTPGKETPTPTPNESSGTSSPSVLNAIEKLIEKSFDSRVRHGAPGMHHPQAGAPIGSSILKRLGIDESVDYTKPLVDPQTMNLLRSYQQQHFNAAAARRERSGSESSSISERGSGRIDAMTPERRLDLSVSGHDRLSTSSTHSHHQRSTPDKQVTPLLARHPPTNDESEEEENVVVKKEPKDEDSEHHQATNDSEHQSESPRKVVVKKELLVDGDGREEDETESFNHHRRSSSSAREVSEERKDVLSPAMNPPTPRPLSQVEQLARSPCRNSTSSPTSSDRSVTPRGTPDTKTSSSLGALSSMFDSLSGAGGGSSANVTDGQGRKTSSHPLAALQKLCDKTETRGSGGSGSNRSGSSSSATLGPSSGSGAAGSGSGPTPGAILAFSWACSDAVVTPDSLMKCAFCDTPFISKGAYRHHLSKMHFVKDGMIPDPLTIGRSAAAVAAAAASVGSQSTSGGGGGGGSGGPSTHSSSSPPSSQRIKSPPIPQANGSPSQPTSSPLEESPHSKFLKYTELAKQLSSKYV